jgi:hypothetical protein
MREKHMRYKHVIIIFLILLAPPSSGALQFIINTLKYPVDLFIHPAGGYLIVLCFIFLLQIGFILWVVMQKNALRGEPFRSYCRSLPISKRTLFNVDITLVIVGINILWVPFILEFVFILAQNDSFGIKVTHLLSVILILLSCFTVSLSIVQKKYPRYFILASFNFALSYILVAQSGWIMLYQTFLLLMILSLMFFEINLKNQGNTGFRKFFLLGYFRKVVNQLLLNSPNITLNLIIVVRQYAVSLSCRVFVSVLILFSSNLIIVRSNHLVYSPQSQLVLAGLFVFLFSGLSCLLLESYGKHKDFFQSLAISSKNVSFSAYMVGLILSGFFCFANIAIAALLSLSIVNIAVLMIFTVLLQGMLHIIQRKFTRFGTFLAMIVTMVSVSITLLIY